MVGMGSQFGLWRDADLGSSVKFWHFLVMDLEESGDPFEIEATYHLPLGCPVTWGKHLLQE